uniref:Zinc finger protein ubi-d4 A n=1 Tax=Zeugodacus cucurbitae TaxID=28588 RepID=A0A0A1XMY1_ZEUCU
MTSAVDLQIGSTPNLNKIENFFKDVSYRETIEFSANFNTRLCLERRLRLPFFDPQTRVAQSHSHLFMDKRHRMPGFRQGQIYTYPSTRWRKSRRQYLNKMYRFPERPFQALRNKEHEAHSNIGTASPLVSSSIASTLDSDLNGTLLDESLSLGAAGGDTSDSKDSQQLVMQQQHTQQAIKEDMSKEWFYDDIEMNELDGIEEPKSPADDEFDYDPRYGSKKRRKRRPSKRASTAAGEGGTGAGRRRGQRGRTSAAASAAAAALSDASLSTFDAADCNSNSLTGDITATPTSTTSSGRRPRGTGGTRGRRRTKANTANNCDPPSPGLNSEPPSFESAAALVGVMGDLSSVNVNDEQGDLRNYRKFL